MAGINARPFVLAFLPVAMRLGLPLRCEHPIDQVGHDQLQLWQAAFAAWLPARLERIELRMPTVKGAPNRTGRGALTAFSGGSDSCYTALTYPREGTGALTAGLMIHGFDIALEDTAGFEAAWDNSRRMMASYGLAPYRLRTNIRDHRKPRLCWERESHGIWLGASLACLEPWFDALAIPSSYPHRRPRVPYGSNALTDPLLGSAAAPLVHHRGEMRRSEKYARLAADPVAADRVRVCFSNRPGELNCGRCFKCVQAQVLFWSHGVAGPAAFPIRATADDIRRTPMEDRDAVRLSASLSEAREAAHAAGLAEIVAALDVALGNGRAAARRELRRQRRRHALLRLLGFGR